MPNASLKNLNIHQLWSIVDCDDYEHLDHEFKPYLPEKDRLFDSLDNTCHDRALEEAIENSSEPLDTYWVLIALAASVSQLYVFMSVLSLTFLYFLKNYEKKEVKFKAEVEENIHFFQLKQLRNDAADELTQRLRQIPGCVEFKTLPHRKSQLDAKPKPVSKLKTVRKGLKVGVCFFGAYYVSTAWVFEFIEMSLITSAMLTPMGLGIMGGIAILVALYCMYDYYKAKQSEHLIKHEKEKITETVSNKRDDCQQLLSFANSRSSFFNSSFSSVSSSLQNDRHRLAIAS